LNKIGHVATDSPRERGLQPVSTHTCQSARLCLRALTYLLAALTTHAAIEFKDGDIVAFLGGADVASAQKNAYLETLVVAGTQPKNIRFRNFGWEGDTVFEQPRDFNFPPLKEHLKKAGATVLLLQFGRMESLQGPARLNDFKTAYAKLIKNLLEITPRVLLVTPPPFESGGDHLPNLQTRNNDLSAYTAAIRTLADDLQLQVIDLFASLAKETQSPRLTDDGLQLTDLGHAALARVIASSLGFDTAAKNAGPLTDKGQWSNPAYENLRTAIIAKDKLWFNYWRPQNWAFLGGDRTEQPSSRDYRDPKIRWFPAEMEKYKPLIEEKEHEMQSLARNIKP